MTSSTQSNPLDRLFVSQKVDLELLAETILPYVQLYASAADSGEILFTEEWGRLNLKGKLLTYLLGRKALSLSGRLPEYEEGATPSQIEAETREKGGSVRPTLSHLVEEKLVRVNQTGAERKYMVPNHALKQIHDQLSQGKE